MSRIDDILSGLANYIVESIHLQPTPVEMKKLNQKQANSELLQAVLEVIDFTSCKPECTDLEHAYHQGSYETAQKIEQGIKELFGVEE